MSTETASPSTETVSIPENTNIDEAARLLDAVGEGTVDETPPPNPGQQQAPSADDPGNAQEEGGDVAQQQEAGEEQTQEQELPALADAPEFWSAEDREHWLTASPEMRETVKRYEAQRIKAVNEKTSEAAAKVREAQQGAAQLLDLVKNSADWWQANRENMQNLMQGKWAGVKWDELVNTDPAEFQRLRFLKEQDDKLLDQVRQQGERDMQITREREMVELAQKKQAANAILATEMPEHFGPGKWEETYKGLGEYLFKQGIPADRINNIHEAPIISMALKAKLWDEAQTKGSVVASQNRDTKTGQFTAKTTPMKRIQPGPATRVAGNQNADEARQVGQRYFGREGGGDIKDAAELIRLRNL